MSQDFPKLRVAAVQAAPVFLDRDATVEKACRLIREAGAKGATVVGFPEGFVPTHPVWNHFYSGRHPRAIALARELFKQSVEIPGPEVDALATAARDAGIYAVVGVCERVRGTTGTLYNSQVVLGPEGLVGWRRKIVPTGGERLVHTGGSGRSIRTFPTPFGPLSALLCAENSNPLAVFAMAAMQTRIHVAAWPQHFHPLSSMADILQMTSRSFAFQAKCFVINAAGVVGDDEIDAIAESETDREYLRRCQRTEGGACIVAPNSRVVAGPLAPGEGLLCADIDLEDCVTGKYVHDYAGHYNRADIFTVTLHRNEPALFQTGDGTDRGGAEEVLQG